MLNDEYSVDGELIDSSESETSWQVRDRLWMYSDRGSPGDELPLVKDEARLIEDGLWLLDVPELGDRGWALSLMN